jgi:alkanesulfonate monooxygenase SsuD/methylene tetrahydromethanopterin reductase-like flavin-dependent oxidoreductase (luciferase family)
MDQWDSMVYGVAPYELPHPMALNGTPAQVVDQIGEVHERHGVSEFLIIDEFPAPHGGEVATEMLELFGTEVMPHFTARSNGAEAGAV